MVFTADSDSVAGDRMDADATRRIADLVEARLPERTGGSRDPAISYVRRLLRCPADAIQSGKSDALGPLDSRCNLK